MELVLEKSPKKVVSIYGQRVELSVPTCEQLEAMIDAGDSDSNAKVASEGRKVIVQCGCPEELAKQLEPEHLGKLLEFITGKKNG